MAEALGKVSAGEVPAIRFKQWIDLWDTYSSVSDGTWKKPQPHLFLFSMKAGDLRTLSDVYRRKYDDDIVAGIQRARDKSRTAKIQKYVRYGYPYGDQPAPLRTQANWHLRKPGWLPTAIVINILSAGDQRRGKTLKPEHVATIRNTGTGFVLCTPEIDREREDVLAPFEVIDGQHRLWSFSDEDGDEPIPEDFELPVVAFVDLDVAWQAYLFWSINVSPKRINKSHAFDLYPLLRTQDWLEQVGEIAVYREARAQELTELMYTFADGAWYHRINMLGERGGAQVSQAAWVRGLTASFFSTGRGTGRGGLFQSKLEPDDEPLPWSRGQQGAFIIQLWNEIKRSILQGPRHWWLRQYKGDSGRPLEDKTSLLNQDMGLRAVLSVANDVFVLRAADWQLDRWRPPTVDDPELVVETELALKGMANTALSQRIEELGQAIVQFDWRSLDGPGVKEDPDQELLKRSLRGSGGYTALRLEVLKTVALSQNAVGAAARDLLAQN